MWNRFSDWLLHISRGWVALSALAAFLVFSALVLPRQTAAAEATAGNAGSPDMSFLYSPGELYRMAEAYGEQGRVAYVKARFTFDLLWPVVYTAFLSTGISWIAARLFTVDSWWRRANLVPVLGAQFDYLENVSTSLVMWRYPARTVVAGALAPVFTSVKWVFVGGSFVLLFTGVVLGVWRWIKKRTGQ